MSYNLDMLPSRKAYAMESTGILPVLWYSLME